MPASSTAMYPLPTIIVLFGLFFNSKKSSEVIPNSAPGISGTTGVAPQAIISAWLSVVHCQHLFLLSSEKRHYP